MKPIVKIMRSDSEILSTFSTFKQLRPHLTEDKFIRKIRRLQDNYGFNLVAVIENDEVNAAAGYRIAESLAWGNYFYVDDLITDEKSRRKGYAKVLWDWLISQAKENDCEQFHLDSGVHRHDAHRFYLKGGLDITCHHFQMSL
ncbi:GNAT family N-acetyltransferase [Priestia endophytica]|jgi:GNAT superfamily N-acetyltransferase|uniref:Acetyltransferase (GNAT) family protein n=1 Tax=Priestia endophytica DSM 13796 TaxID=1121089 RepID=A0A1I6C8M1_9BACI|nr:GNAT family N-acetyltransferase [Priestia endophytica]KYG29045.1 GCN5 family acetyltransferase [Priestia endophytica]MBG9812016.1 GCN5 family acetyltransferase [Priestia endophytica]SFQ89543.1 Acetyltransferase (GNAT) family protein [Priestia endophytica DSM 13796]